MPNKHDPILPYGRHLLDEDDVAAVVAVLRGDWLTTGPAVEALEKAFAARVGARHAVSCSSGTGALHLAALALGLGRDDAVIVPAMTFLATANAARFVGAEVVFADVDADTGLMTATHLRRALERSGDNVRAVFPVHLNGQTVDLEAADAVCRERGLHVVEDACHSLGATVETKRGERFPVGSCTHSAMAVFSLHPVKTVTMGEGGVVTTNDEALYRRLSCMRNHGIVREPNAFEQAALAFDAERRAHPWYYEMSEIGFNYRASDIHCALGTSQLKKLDRFVARRRALVERYVERLAPLAPLVHPLGRVERCDPAWHLCVVLIDFDAAGTTRGAVMRALRERGVSTQVHYLPLHLQPYYRRRYGDLDLPGAQAYYQRTLSLPLFPAMKPADVDRVVDALGAAVTHFRR